MKRILFISSTFILCIVLHVSCAFAEIPVNAVGITPHIGGYVFEGDQDEDNGPLYGLGLEYIFSQQWSFEAMFDYIDSESSNGDVDGYLYRVDSLYHFASSNNLVPYLAVGLGGLTLDRERGDSNTDFLFDYGAGLKYFVTYNLVLRGDVRHILSFNGHGNNLVYTFGLTFLFGGKAKEVVPVDSDGDGVYDPEDQCPDTPIDIQVDNRGCPLDSDRDGVFDYMDRCLDTPAGVSVDDFGCPLDTDGDGVYDSQDQCPDTPKGAKVDPRGCWTLGGVLFDTDKWNIKPQFSLLLDDVVNVLRHNPGLKLEIQGHTDSRGARSHNIKLSQKRAEAVRKYLVAKGISTERLTAKGFGCARPVASNNTPEGRAMNRRVELKPVYR